MKSTVEVNGAAEGGGIFNDGMLLVAESQVSGNEAGGRGGGIVNYGDLTLSAVELSHNHAGEVGGAAENTEGGMLTVQDGTISWNHADVAGGIFNTGTMSLITSTVSWNDALVLGGIWNDFNGAVAVTNSTVSSNGARFLVSDVYNDGTLSLTNSTVSKSAQDLPSAILDTGFLVMSRSLVAGDCDGAIVSNGYNLESPGNTCRFDEATDLPRVSADLLKLGELGENGGPTLTHALLPGSRAIDRIPHILFNVLLTAEGHCRDRVVGSRW